jgi:plasmid maintenance system antidote protein VapI
MATAATETPAAMLGLRIMTLLHRQQMSVYMLAKRAEVPLRTVQRIVAGDGKQPSVWTIAALARVLGVSVDALIAVPAREDTPTPQSAAKHPRPRKAAPVG